MPSLKSAVWRMAAFLFYGLGDLPVELLCLCSADSRDLVARNGAGLFPSSCRASSCAGASTFGAQSHSPAQAVCFFSAKDARGRRSARALSRMLAIR